MTLREEAKRIIANYADIEPDEIGPLTTLDSLDLDSLDQVEIVMEVEDCCGVDIEDAAMPIFKDAEALTVEQFIDALERAVKK